MEKQSFVTLGGDSPRRAGGHCAAIPAKFGSIGVPAGGFVSLAVVNEK
jgi:hypothetical protein